MILHYDHSNEEWLNIKWHQRQMSIKAPDWDCGEKWDGVHSVCTCTFVEGRKFTLLYLKYFKCYTTPSDSVLLFSPMVLVLPQHEADVSPVSPLPPCWWRRWLLINYLMVRVKSIRRVITMVIGNLWLPVVRGRYITNEQIISQNPSHASNRIVFMIKTFTTKEGETFLLQSNWCSSLYPGESNTKNSLSNYIEHQHKQRNMTTFVIVHKTFALIITAFCSRSLWSSDQF